jgi:hypothetical protein
VAFSVLQRPSALVMLVSLSIVFLSVSLSPATSDRVSASKSFDPATHRASALLSRSPHLRGLINLFLETEDSSLHRIRAWNSAFGNKRNAAIKKEYLPVILNWYSLTSLDLDSRYNLLGTKASDSDSVCYEAARSYLISRYCTRCHRVQTTPPFRSSSQTENESRSETLIPIIRHHARLRHQQSTARRLPSSRELSRQPQPAGDRASVESHLRNKA